VSEQRADTDRLVDSFLLCTLPKDEWTHHAHLRVGLWYLIHYPPSESLDRLRENIKQYNIACGIDNTDSHGYHETITQFYIWVVDRFIRNSDRSNHVDLLANKLVNCYGDRHLILEYYTHDLLMSKTARLNWVEPDLKPLI
jgi:hypothetical protein